MADRRPVTDYDRDQVAALHAEGLSRNEIARRLRRSGKTVSRLAAELGLSFERGPEVAAATEARKIDAKAARAKLALALLEDAARLRSQLWQPASYVAHGGKEYERVDWTMDEPTFADKRNIMQAIGVAVDRSVKLDEHDKADAATSGVDAWLAHIADDGDD